MPATQVADVLLVHPARLQRVAVSCGHIAGRKRRHATEVVRNIRAVMHQLDARQPAVLMNCACHKAVGWNIAVIPQTHLDCGGKITGWVYFAFFRANNTPTASCFHAAHRRHSFGKTMPHAIAMRHLIKSVFGSDRPDSNRFEQNIVSFIAGHFETPCGTEMYLSGKYCLTARGYRKYSALIAMAAQSKSFIVKT